MKKMKFLFFFGLLFSTFSIATEKSNKTVRAEEPEPSITLEFEDVETNRYNTYVKHCTNYFPAKIIEHFRAPAGSVFKLETDVLKMEPIVDEIMKLEAFDDDEMVSMIDVVAERKLNGVSMYGDSMPQWDINISDLDSVLCTRINDLEIYITEEKTMSFCIGASFDIEIYPRNSEYTYVYTFDVSDYNAKPYENGDLLFISGHTFVNYPEQRFSVICAIDDAKEEIFNEEYGFLTDGRYEDYSGHWAEKYSLDIIHKETNVILGNDYMVEMHVIPETPMTIFARLTFISGGKEYAIYSNEIVAEEKMPTALLDGYDNRLSYGLNDENSHVLRFRTTIDLESISEFTIEPYYFKNEEMISLGNHCFQEAGDPLLLKIDGCTIFNELSNSFFEFPLNFDEVGEYTIYANFSILTRDNTYFYNSSNTWSKVIKVEQGEIKHINLEEALTINATIDNELIEGFKSTVEENSLCLIAGGKPIKIETFVDEDVLNSNSKPIIYVNTEDISNCVNVKISDDGKSITLNPYNQGNVCVVITADIEGIGETSKIINLKVVEGKSLNSSLNVPDEFHYSNTDLKVKFIPDSNEKVSNYRLDWTVVDENNQPAPFIVSDDMKEITLISPKQGDYTVAVLSNGFNLHSTVIQIRDFNIDKFVHDNIWWMLLVSLALMGGVIAIKIFLNKNNTIVDQINSACQLVEQMDVTSNNFYKDVFKLKLILQKEISYSRDLNIDGMNQYEKTIRYLNKSMMDLNGLNKNFGLSNEQKQLGLDQLKKDLNKALVVVTDLQAAKIVSKENSINANANNYAKIDKKK